MVSTPLWARGIKPNEREYLLALGMLTQQWNEAELSLHFLIAALLQQEIEEAAMIVRHLGSVSALKVAEELCNARITSPRTCDFIGRCLKHFEKCKLIRNQFVHGRIVQLGYANYGDGLLLTAPNPNRPKSRLTKVTTAEVVAAARECNHCDRQLIEAFNLVDEFFELGADYDESAPHIVALLQEFQSQPSSPNNPRPPGKPKRQPRSSRV